MFETQWNFFHANFFCKNKNKNKKQRKSFRSDLGNLPSLLALRASVDSLAALQIDVTRPLSVQLTGGAGSERVQHTS